MTYTHFKDFVSQYTGLEKDALHIHVALFVYLLAAFLFRRSPRSPLPWLVVLGIELANEAHDLWQNWGAPWSWLLGEGAKDLWNTMLWPTVLMAAARFSPWFRRPVTVPEAVALPDEPAPSGEGPPGARPGEPGPG